MHEFMSPKPFLVLSQRTCPIHYFSLKLMFWVVPCHFIAHLTRCKNRYRGTFNARVCASRTVSCFFCSKHALSTSFSLKLKFWMVSHHLLPHLTRCKISIGVHLKHEFVPRKPFLVRSQRTCSIHSFRS